MNGDALGHFAGTTGINQYCPGKWDAEFPCVSEGTVRGDFSRLDTGFIVKYNMEYTL